MYIETTIKPFKPDTSIISGVFMGVGKVSYYTSFFARTFFLPPPLRHPPHFLTNFSNFVRPSVCCISICNNSMEQTHNILVWLMQLTSAYALVEVYPAL